MREIDAQEVTKTVSLLCQEANFFLPEDVFDALKQSRKTEESPLGQQILDQLLKNAKMAQDEQLAICQDCGVAVVYLEIGQDVGITPAAISQCGPMVIVAALAAVVDEAIYRRRAAKNASLRQWNTAPLGQFVRLRVELPGKSRVEHRLDKTGRNVKVGVPVSRSGFQQTYRGIAIFGQKICQDGAGGT